MNSTIHKARIALLVLNASLTVTLLVYTKIALLEPNEAHNPAIDVKTLAVKVVPHEDAPRYAVIWEQIDKVPDAPPPAAPPAPAPESLEGKMRIALVGVDPVRDPFGCIVQLTGGEQIVFQPG